MNGLFDSLVAEIDLEYLRWKWGTRVYGTIYPSVRVVVIVASATVAAEKTLVGSEVASLVSWVPVLALVVAIATALDTWIKPRDKWRGFMMDRDDAADLLIRVRGTAQDDTESIHRLRTDFAELRRRHRDKNVY